MSVRIDFGCGRPGECISQDCKETFVIAVAGTLPPGGRPVLCHIESAFCNVVVLFLYRQKVGQVIIGRHAIAGRARVVINLCLGARSYPDTFAAGKQLLGGRLSFTLDIIVPCAFNRIFRNNAA